MKHREPTDVERALWEQAMREVLPVKRRRKPVAASSASAAASRQASSPKSVRMPGPTLSNGGAIAVSRPVTASRLDGATLGRLREGKVEPEARLDLHGLTQVQAHARLVTFLHRAREHGLRCVLIITGKGSSLPRRDQYPEWMLDASRGVLRTLVPRWLGEGELKNHVSGHAEAHVRHGGGGAIYVYLRQNRSR